MNDRVDFNAVIQDSGTHQASDDQKPVAKHILPFAPQSESN